ncbi:MAG: 1,4-dihydroxy-2-naphthoate polyprenyltransferase [Candidatus Nanopelagicales bacterium]
MTTAHDWVAGARPRTLPAAIAPVAVGSGAADFADGFVWWRALLCLIVALALQIGVNYANDYSDGVRGTDTSRVGPMRLVGSGTATATSVRTAAVMSFAVAAAAGLVLAAVSSWWLLLVGAAAIAAAFFYTGGPRPYGYAGLGEVFVLVFFGFVAVCGTTYVQAGEITGVAWLGGLGVGLLACAVLVVNNLRDIPTDSAAGKRTLAVRLGDRRTRMLYVVLVTVPFLVTTVMAVVALAALIAIAAFPLTFAPMRAVLSVARGPALVPVLTGTGRVLLAYGLLLGLGLALSG